MSIEIKSPTFPESVADGTIANWVKKEGESVKQDEVIAEIETDKVVLEVVAPFDGIISKVLKPAGEVVLSAELIAEFEEGGQADNEKETSSENLSEPSSYSKKETPVIDDNKSKKNGPAVKKLLNEHGLDENNIDGTGKDGRLTKADIVNHLDSPANEEKEINTLSNTSAPVPLFQSIS